MTVPPPSLRILHVASHDRIASGGSIQLLRAAVGQRERGHEVSCVFHRGRRTGRRGHPSLDRIAAESIPVEVLRMRGLLRPLRLGRMRRILERGAFHVVHVHRERALAFVLDALGPGVPPFALLAQKGNTNRARPEALRRFLDPRLEMVVAVAGAVRDRLVADGVDGDRVRVVYGSVDTNHFHPGVDGSEFRREIGVARDAPLVGLLANLDGKKAHEVFLDAAAVVIAARPETRFVLVGRGRGDGLRKAAETRGLGDALVLAGFREDVPACLAAFDVSVNCSNRSEGLTGAIRESLAMARPVVCTRVGGNEELVRDGETGRIVDRDDPEALADAILWTIDHPDEAARQAERGRALVLRDMTQDVRMERLEALYREILARRPPPV